jgi:hypothetical protein
MELELQAPNNRAPVWFSQANTLFTTGKPPGHTIPLHAEDGVYFNWEASKDAITTDNLYPVGSIMAVWGKFGHDLVDHEIGLCQTPLKFEDRRFKGITRSCQTLASHLGVGYAGNLTSQVVQQPPPPQHRSHNHFHQLRMMSRITAWGVVRWKRI